MFNRSISPRLCQNDYESVRALLKDKMRLVPHDQRAKTFIFKLKQYYNMELIASYLGVSVRHLYRILNNISDHSKNDKINMLVYFWFESTDFVDFLDRLAFNNIEVNRYEN